jgi:hypothetical protein
VSAGAIVRDRLIAVCLGVLLSAACAPAPEPAGPVFDLEAEAAAVDRERAALAAARRALESAAPAPAAPSAPPGEPLVAARREFDRAYAAYQQRLAAFLNVALNQHPRAEATRRVLTAYADEAVRWSQEVARRQGDVDAARRQLREIAADFEAIGAPVPPALARAAGS